ncbi:DHS-like NAD/FAD-binding domain-containing protein [Mariannaea sp. PMI_226]|nr:DHS-like NAD/FAD-binding domain-containing protein [Mariannaea sp. PMI_226]
MAPHNDVEAFHEVLRSSKRMLALCGAGLSASSGLPTFRGAGGLWRNYEATSLATMNAFRTDPGLVWLFYGYRRHMCLRADPNPGHYALAALARENKDFLCLTQNVDNLSQRADHPTEQIRTLHGSLFNIKCSNAKCDWVQHGNYDDPFCPALAPASLDFPPDEKNPLLDPYHRIKHVTEEELPKCPSCGTGLQRPGVVWFSENLDRDMLNGVDNWIKAGKLDLMFVIGTSAKVWPAAGYIQKAKEAGARVVIVNPDAENEDEMNKIHPGDFAFGQDAAEYLPLLLEPVIGKLPDEQMKRLNTRRIATHPSTMQGFNMGRYVPPDVEGTTTGNRLHGKHALGSRASKLASHGALVVRFELPFAVWCTSCPKPTVIGQGVRFNAEKKRVGNYHSTPIWSFRFRHADCGGAIEIRTDPKNTAYVVTEGGTKRDMGEDKVLDGDQVILTDQEREALRKNAFAKLEKTIADRQQLKEATERIDDLVEASARHWDDPYTHNQKLRRAFRAERKSRESAAAAVEHLKDRMSLGIDIVPATEEDARRAALVDFGTLDDTRDRALTKPLFESTQRATGKSRKSPHTGSLETPKMLKSEKQAAWRKESLVSELMGNTRAAKDPFLLDTKSGNGESKPSSRLVGVKRKRASPNGDTPPASKALLQEASGLAGLVNYESD